MSLLYSVPGLRRILLWLENAFFNLYFSRLVGNRVAVFSLPITSIHPRSRVRVGKNLVLISSPYFSEPGVNHPVVIRTIAPDAEIQIGNNVGMSGGGIVAAKSVTIGDDVMFGANAFVTDTDFHPLNPSDRRRSREDVGCEAVVVEDNVFIGMNALVLKGVRIGRNSVIAAGSIVSSDVPANSVAAGIPAKVVKIL